MMTEINCNVETIDYIMNRIIDLTNKNNGLNWQNKELIRKERELNGELIVLRKNQERYSKKLEIERKDAKRMLETIENLNNEIKTLKGETSVKNLSKEEKVKLKEVLND